MNKDKTKQAKEIMNKLLADSLFDRYGMEVALRTFPDLKDYLEEIKDRDFWEVRKELEDQLQQIKIDDD